MLNRPCFMLHQCQTAALLELMLPSMSDSGATPAAAQLPAADRSTQDFTSCEPRFTAAVPSAANNHASCEASTERFPPSAGSSVAATWQLQYMLAWWSVAGSVVKLALPALMYV